jgi:type IV secretion system protein VirB9
MTTAKRIISKKILCFILVFLPIMQANSYNDGYAYDDLEVANLTTDTRIKTYIYNPSEVYLLVLHYGFQSNIEFSKGEKVQTISLGDTYSWKITPLDNLLFIRPMEKNIRTNMTIITNKNTYQFDLVAQDLDEGNEKDLVYSVRFYYPKKLKKNVKK